MTPKGQYNEVYLRQYSKGYIKIITFMQNCKSKMLSDWSVVKKGHNPLLC